MKPYEKRCRRCKEVKNRSQFWRDQSQKDGLNPHCKPCRKATASPTPDPVFLAEIRERQRAERRRLARYRRRLDPGPPRDLLERV